MLNRVIPQFFFRNFSTSRIRRNKQVCVIGSGPAGFYFVQHLLKAVPDVSVDIYEKLPVPFGLVRYGVAPDHPEVKNVINTFTKTALNKNVNFIGNVTVGKDVSFKELQEAYHAVVLTYGCSEDTTLNIEGENDKGVFSARKFVGWYNGLPEDRNLNVDLSGKSAVILGQGNVAVDVARILLTPIDILKKTDITSYALEELSRSQIERVYLVGRRGPLHVAFTIKEFREMTKLPDVQTIFSLKQLFGLNEYVKDLVRPRKRLTELIIKTSQTPQKGSKAFYPLFLRKPIKVIIKDKVQAVRFSINKIIDNLEGIVETTQETEDIPCDIVFRSIGYKGSCPDQTIPFDSQKCIVQPSVGLYCAGWIHTGPTGVILSTMNDAFQQAEVLAMHFQTNKLNTSITKPGYHIIRSLLSQRSVPVVNFQGWQRIDLVEIERGAKLGKPREKIVDIAEMLRIGST